MQSNEAQTWYDLFVIGSQCGLKPEEVLDCNLSTLEAYVAGYQDRIFDLECIAVTTGFWSAYYSNAKHAKPVNTILHRMQQLHLQQRSTGTIEKPRPDVDVETFLERERSFQERSEQLGRRK